MFKLLVMPKSKETVTLRDVARQAGVSLGTASQALSNRGSVAPETRVHVQMIAAEMGYQHQMRATPVERRPLATVGMILRHTQDEPGVLNPFYSYVLAGIERECRRQNLVLNFASIDVDARNRPTALPPLLNDQHVDGILLVGTFIEDTIMEVSQRADLPMVLVDAYAPGKAFDSVIIDNLTGAYEAVNYLIDRGHRHIGCVGSTPDAYPSIRERRKGYQRALKHHEITANYLIVSPLTREGGYEATYQLLQTSPQVSAIFACNDDVAVGVMHAARDLGRSLPDDLSVVGFDDIDLAQEVTPALTTVHVDKVLMGALAVRYLRDRTETPRRSGLTTALSTQLIVRESVRPPRP